MARAMFAQCDAGHTRRWRGPEWWRIMRADKWWERHIFCKSTATKRTMRGLP